MSSRISKDILKHPLFWITLSLPIVLLATLPLLPTHDDWGLAPPEPNPEPFTWKILLPRYTSWRPMEHIYGWLCGHYRFLFPYLGHIIVVIGHYISTITVWRICRQLHFSLKASTIATIFLWVGVGHIATITACDGMSQTWVATIGLLSLHAYLHDSDSKRWLAIMATAMVIKENLIVWPFIIPVLGYFIGGDYNAEWQVSHTKTDSSKPAIRKTLRNLCYGACLVIVYLTIHFSLPVDENYAFNTEYLEFSFVRILSNLTRFLAFTWFPVDYAAVVTAANRNILLTIVTAGLSIPFLICLAHSMMKSIRDIRMLVLIVCLFGVSSIHLLTIFSLMHLYAGLGIAALLVGYIVNTMQKDSKLNVAIAFTMYAIAAIITDAHHYMAAYDSGILGKRLSMECVSKTGKPVNSAFLLYVDENFEKYSNFYVIPIDAMGWGIGVRWETEFQWPDRVMDSTITESATADMEIKHLSDSIIHSGYECVWILRKEKTTGEYAIEVRR